jgi:prevent-host-death family protein
MESMTSTETQNHFGKVLGRVLRGAVVSITRHEEVSAVLLSAETYQALIHEHADPLAELRERFDLRFAAMQTSKSKAGALALFSANSEDLGRAAVKGAKKRG